MLVFRGLGPVYPNVNCRFIRKGLRFHLNDDSELQPGNSFRLHCVDLGPVLCTQWVIARSLCRNLPLTVGLVMKPLDKCAVVTPGTSLRGTVIAMTKFPLGSALLANADGTLAGIITDGDLRRALSQDADLLNRKASEIATAKPVRGHLGLTLGDAARLMEERPSQIFVLPVIDPDSNKALGLVRIHDVHQARMA